MSAYYNEFDPKAAAWLRELIKRGLIADGDVDERSILDVAPDDLRGFTQCHFFAGIGGWSYALRLAGWPEDRPVWTGSPPCQPFSAAGAGLGRDDARHLAPHFISLVGACRPRVLFGEQVASSAVFGKAASGTRNKPASTPEWAWLDDLQDRLEAARYAVGASDIPAAGIGGFHIRQRTFFGAIDGMGNAASWRERIGVNDNGSGWRDKGEDRTTGAIDRLADADSSRPQGHGGSIGEHDAIGRKIKAGHCAEDCQHSRLADDNSIGCKPLPVSELHNSKPDIEPRSNTDRLADAEACGRGEECSDDRGRTVGNSTQGRAAGYWSSRADGGPDQDQSIWRDPDWLFCRDGKFRPVEPGTFPLANGIPARVVRLRGYGNAIVPQAAAKFIQAFTETIDSVAFSRVVL